MEKIWEIVLLLALIAFLAKAFLFEQQSPVRPEQPVSLSLGIQESVQ